ALPGGQEKESHGRPAFFTKKVFAYYGGSLKVDGEWVQHDQSVMILPDSEERPALVSDDRFWVPGYLGPSGWLGLDLDEETDYEEVAELIESSYRVTAPARMVADLDVVRD
ncbi:MAG: MmcQ/YjbR family DNA-binding protein, partial [Acidimicrobiia bacterium]|nr:MmcQ/YjbR family DNA-binding protein [Acidimicrobiia bacterium]